jgi:hypothetical protein
MDSDHHPKAVILSSGRAFPGEIHNGEIVKSVLASEAISSQASLCGGKAGKGLENDDPAEPDDPNSFSLNPNEKKTMTGPKRQIMVDFPQSSSVDCF